MPVINMVAHLTKYADFFYESAEAKTPERLTLQQNVHDINYTRMMHAIWAPFY